MDALIFKVPLQAPGQDEALLHDACLELLPGRHCADALVRLGKVLFAVRELEVYQRLGHPDFAAWLQKRLGIKAPQAERYIKIKDLPEDRLAGRRISLHRLGIMADDQAGPLLPALLQFAATVPEPRGRDPLCVARDAGLAELRVTRDPEKARAAVLSAAHRKPRRAAPLDAVLEAIGKNQARYRSLLGRLVDLRAQGDGPSDAVLEEILARNQEAEEEMMAALGLEYEECEDDAPPAQPPLHDQRAVPREDASCPRGQNAPFANDSSEMEGTHEEDAVDGAAYDPLLHAVARLDAAAQKDLEECLYLTVIGYEPGPLRPRMEAVLRGLAGVGPGLVEGFLAEMGHPEWEERGSFALWFMLSAELDDYRMDLYLALGSELPPALRREVWDATRTVGFTPECEDPRRYWGVMVAEV